MKILSDNQKINIKNLYIIGACCEPDEKEFLLHLTIFTNPPIKSTKMQTALLTTQQVAGQVTPTTATGKTAKVQKDTVEYSTSDAAVAEVVEDTTDETQFTIVARGVGTATITVSADADLGEGVVTITGEIQVDVTEEGATGFGVTLGQATEQPV